MSYELEFTLWFSVTFVLVVGFLFVFVRKPLLKALDKRADKIKNDLNSAENVRMENEKIKAEQERILEDTRQKAKAFFEEEKKQAESIKKYIIESAKQHAQEIIQLSHKEVQAMKENAIEEIKYYIVNSSCDLAGEVMKHSLTKDDNRKIIIESLSTMGQSFEQTN